MDIQFCLQLAILSSSEIMSFVTDQLVMKYSEIQAELL